MESAPYHFVELNSETVMHAVELQNKIGEEISEEEIELFANALEKENNVANQTLGAQKGFIVFQRDKAVAYLGNAYESTVGQLITQNLGGFVTDPEIRSRKLLTAIKNRVLQTQHPGYAYLYTAWAEPKTSYKGLVQPGVQKWLQRSGYNVLLEPDHEELSQKGDHVSISLYADPQVLFSKIEQAARNQ